MTTNTDVIDLSPPWRRALARRVLAWFAHAARDLPWRGTSDLYAIWISEVMLQQTQVATVIPYWRRFLERFPDVASLAAAPEQEVFRYWEGLGYYRRARQLHAAARQIATEHAGQMPESFDEWRALPGVGRYTAGAVLSIGRDQRLPIVEANTIRVLSRLTAFAGDPTSTAGQKYLWSVAEAILPAKKCGAFNQALMELGSEICTVKSPACGQCPVGSLCEAHRRDLVEQIPRPPRKTIYTPVTEAAVVARLGQSVLLRQCQAGERWAGLWDFPRFAVPADLPEANLAGYLQRCVREQTGVRVKLGRKLATLKHGVTRFRITLHCFAAALQARAVPSASASGLAWPAMSELAAYPLSVTGRKLSQMLLDGA